MTFSLAARCPRTGMLGVAVTTSSIAVGSRCAFARARVGGVLTQHRTDPRLGPLGLELLAQGKTAQEAIDALVAIAPAAAAMVTMTTLTLNLWLGAKITATSSRLNRPWPDLKSADLPPMTLAALCVTIAFCFTGGLPAILAQIATAALMMAYGFTGFAVLHTLTLAMKSRALWLSSTYAIVMVFGWPVLAMVVLGLADAVFGIRQRYLQGRPPPLPAS